MTTANVTQVGAEAWASLPAAATVTQAGVEAWYVYRADLMVTQLGVEVWRTVALTDVGGPSVGGGAVLLIGL